MKANVSILAMKTGAYLLALSALLLGGLFTIGAFGNLGQMSWIYTGAILLASGLGLIVFASRRVEIALSVDKVITSLAASCLIVLGGFLTVLGVGEQVKVWAILVGLISIGVGFGLIWLAQRPGRAAPLEKTPFAQSDEAIIPATKLRRANRRLWIIAGITGSGVIGLAICFFGLVYLGILDGRNTVQAMLPFEASGIILEYPASWRQLDPKEIETFDEQDEIIIALNAPKGNGFFKVMRWKVDHQTKNSFAMGMDQSIRTNAEAELLGKDEITVGGEKAISWIYTGECPGYPDRTCKYRSIITEKNGFCYLISYVDDLSSFDGYRPALDHIITRIKFSIMDSTRLVCSSHDSIAMAKYEQAHEMTDLGKLPEAEKLYREALALDADFCDAMDNLGVVLRRQGKVDEAIGWYQKSLEIKPENQLALRNLGIAYIVLGNSERAINTFEQLIQIAPDDPEGYYHLGLVYFNLQEYEKAIANFEIAEKIYKQTSSTEIADAQYYLGHTYFMLQDCAKAKSYLEPIYDERQEESQINYVLGVCYLDAMPKDLELAKKFLLKAESLGSTLPNALLEQLQAEFGEWPPK